MQTADNDGSNAKHMTNQSKEIRRSAGVLTDQEVAQALAIPLWQVRRTQTLGVKPFNRFAGGKMMFHQHDLWDLARNADLPNTRGSWFDEDETFDIRYFDHHVRHGNGDPRSSFAAKFLSTNWTLGQAILIGSARSFAKYELRKGNRQYGFNGQPTTLEGFYNCGPDAWRVFEQDCRTRLLGLEYRLNGQPQQLSSLCRFGFESLVRSCIKEAF